MLGLAAGTMAQSLPNYVPADGLVGWWPFNGNANDESGNGNDGVVNGAELTSDRFNNSISAFHFTNDVNSSITINDNPSLSFGDELTISHWVKFNQPWTYHVENTIYKKDPFTNQGFAFGVNQDDFFYGNENYTIGWGVGNGTTFFPCNSHPNQVTQFGFLSDWHHYTGVYNGLSVKLYIDGSFVSEELAYGLINNSPNSLVFGGSENPVSGAYSRNIDDIGIWNRALSQEEITALYTATNCTSDLSISPSSNALQTGSTATFTATTTDPNPSYVWQSDFGQGYVTLIRAISTSGECIDTSNVSIISIADTCINSITDTSFIAVTDTLIINTLITGINPPANSNTIKVFPNPAGSFITIDYGNFALMSGYQLRIENSLGQQVFQTNITQQSDYLSLSTWGGNGLYFVHIIDPQGNTIDIRKIVLQ
jgi:hypothetical protein